MTEVMYPRITYDHHLVSCKSDEMTSDTSHNMDKQIPTGLHHYSSQNATTSMSRSCPIVTISTQMSVDSCEYGDRLVTKTKLHDITM